MVESDSSDEDEIDGILAELRGLAPLTEADTAPIIAVVPFNIHRYPRNAPVVNFLDVRVSRPTRLHTCDGHLLERCRHSVYLCPSVAVSG